MSTHKSVHEIGRDVKEKGASDVYEDFTIFETRNKRK